MWIRQGAKILFLRPFATGSVAWAQSLKVDGHVLDPQGKPVPGASIHLLIGTEDTAQTKSGDQGHFQFDGLIRTTYTVGPEAPGWSRRRKPSLADRR